MTQQEAFVGLNLIPGIGSSRLNSLLQFFGSPQEIFRASRLQLEKVPGIGAQLAGQIAAFKKDQIQEELELSAKLGLEIIALTDAGYPENLKQIPGAPILLYVWGKLLSRDSLAVGIVGSRQASYYGLSAAEDFSAGLAGCGITIVSGMARGVDTFAHRAALKNAGRTIAVMGSGFGHIYPDENRELARQISLQGAVISEFPVRTNPHPQNFPRRNRLISGLSLGVLITEAAQNSGALITADFALEQGRDVFAVPGRIDTPGSTGTNGLIKQGAKLVTCCQDILEEIAQPPASSAAVQDKPAQGLGQENRIYGFIGAHPLGIDELVLRSGLSSSRVLELVLKLKLKQLIRILPGNQYMRN